VYAATDRHDEATDRIRAVRDERWKYIRNYQPEKPYGQSVTFRNNLDTMKEIFRLHDEGRLEPPADWYFRERKPIEELYDTLADPFELENLAGRPELQETLLRLRAAHEQWLADFDDLGAISEEEMREAMWPGGVQPATEAPVILPAGGSFDGPVAVVLSSPTEGASIGYTLDAGPAARWHLYSRPLRLTESGTLRAKAIRYGLAESGETEATFEIPSNGSR
jgi:hypothetical protein